MVDEIARDPYTRNLTIQETDTHFGFRTVFLGEQRLRYLPPPGCARGRWITTSNTG